MVSLVSFPEAVERRVRFVEETPPAQIVEATLHRLAAGEAPLDLITAAALAVTRSTELPADHHGGPIHPVAGIHAVAALVERLGGDDARLAVTQCVALANKHIHLPSMGPSAMVAFDDLDPSTAAPDKSLEALSRALVNHEPRLAERALTRACGQASKGAMLDCLMTVAIARNSLDDHYFLFALYSARALDAIGWDWAPVLLRRVVQYLARHASFEPFGEFTRETIDEGLAYFKRQGELTALIERYNLAAVPQSGAGEEDAVAALADQVGAAGKIAALPEVVAQALAAGLSLEGAGEALSVGAARLFLRSNSANPFDVHLHTGISARRYLLGFPEVSLRHKLLGLLGWAWGYEVRYFDPSLVWDWQSPAVTLEPLAAAGETALLAEIERRILALRGYDVTRLTIAINLTVADQDVRDIARLAEAYAKAGFDPEALFGLTARLVCREDVSEMHAYKMQQAAYEEYRACRETLRWVHLVSAVKQAAVVVPLSPCRVYPRAAAVLAA